MFSTGSASIGETLFSARSLDEYRAMFALSAASLRESILDCPGGAASFAASLPHVVAVDPLYALPPSALGERALADAVRGHGFLRDPARAARFVWTYFADADAHLSSRLRSANLFAADIAARPGRYVAAALPSLPFPDRTFDVVLSSHFLFTYSERFSPEFHTAALLELARVARREVRVFPILQHVDGLRYEHLESVLAKVGLRSELRRVEYEFQQGGNEMLIVHN